MERTLCLSMRVLSTKKSGNVFCNQTSMLVWPGYLVVAVVKEALAAVGWVVAHQVAGWAVAAVEGWEGVVAVGWAAAVGVGEVAEAGAEGLVVGGSAVAVTVVMEGPPQAACSKAGGIV